MKRLIYAIILATMPFMASAQNTGLFGSNLSGTKKVADYSAYMQGAVPEAGGKVTFTHTFKADGKTKADLYNALASWASARYMADVENGKWNDRDYFRNLQYARVSQNDKQAGLIVCQASEEQVFSNKFLEKDYTEMEYVLTINIKDGEVSATMTDIAYNYTFTSKRERRPAEQVITDAEVFTKKGKWIKSYRKFRVKTVDLANELFREIAFTIE